MNATITTLDGAPLAEIDAGFRSMSSTDDYGHGIDEIIWGPHCDSYDSAAFVRLALAAATEAGLSGEALCQLAAWIRSPKSHTAILPAELALRGVLRHSNRGQEGRYGDDGDDGDDIDAVLAAVPRVDVELLRLCMAALDQAGMSVAGQQGVRELLGVGA